MMMESTPSSSTTSSVINTPPPTATTQQQQQQQQQTALNKISHNNAVSNTSEIYNVSNTMQQQQRQQKQQHNHQQQQLQPTIPNEQQYQHQVQHLENGLQSTKDNQDPKYNKKLNKINKLPQPKRDELYWCWSLKEYIRLGHIKSIFRILKILDHQTPYNYNDAFNDTDEKTLQIDTLPNTLKNINHNNHNYNIIHNKSGYTYHFKSKPVYDPKRSNFPYLYMPNILRQKSDILLCLNSKLLSISNILHTLSKGNIDSLLLPNYLPVPKSLPVVPFLLIIIYFKLCLSKGDNARSIIDSLMECRQSINLLPAYDCQSIPPIEMLLDNIMHVTLRFIDWIQDDTNQLIPTEVYFNEVFEVIYLTGRDFLDLNNNHQQNNSNSSNEIHNHNQQPQQTQQQQNHKQQQQLSNGSILSTITIATDEHKFKMVDIYLRDSRKIVFLNIGSLAQKRGSMKLSIWSKENINTLLKCCRFYLQVFNNLNNIINNNNNNNNNNKSIPTNNDSETTKDDTITILDCCMRLSFSWATLCSGILPNSLEKYSDLGSCWWNLQNDQLQLVLKDWIEIISRIFIEIDSNTSMSTKNLDKLQLVCLVWLASTISLFDDEDQDQQQQQEQQTNQKLIQQQNSYSVYIKNIDKHPELLIDFTKSSLVITSIGFALIGVTTLEQTLELIQKLVNLWQQPQQTQQHQSVVMDQSKSSQSIDNLLPSLENVCLIFKTLQNVLNTKFKIENFNNQDELVMALISWLQCVVDEIYNLFYSCSINSRFLCIFIGSSIVHALKRNKNIVSHVPESIKKDIIGKVQELFYTLICQHSFLTKSFKIGLATAYCLSCIDPFSEKQANQSILMISLDVLLDEILLINGSLLIWLDNSSGSGNINGTTNAAGNNNNNGFNSFIIKKIESHKTTPLFLSIPPFISSISGLILNLHDNDNNKLVLLKLCDFIFSLNEKWLAYYESINVGQQMIPKSMIRKSLDPTFNAIFQSLSLLFFEISSILTPMDSVVAIELFTSLSFLNGDHNDDSVQIIIAKAIRALSKNVLTSECAIIRLIDKMPLYYQVPKGDKIACSQVVIYFYSLECLITMVPHNLIVGHIVPNLFEYMEYPNSKLNSLCHSILGKMFSIPNFHLSIKMIPMYLKTALKTFPKFTKVSSLYEVLVSIIENNSPTNPIVLYSIKTISNSIINYMEESNNSNSNNSGSNGVGKIENGNGNEDKQVFDSSTLINHSHKKFKDSKLSITAPISTSASNITTLNVASKGLIKLLFSLFLYIDIQIIDLVLDEIKKVIINSPNQKIRLELCSDLLTEITGNLENNTKKNICISWYLNFIHEIENLNN